MEPQPELLPLYLELIDTYTESGQTTLRDYFVLLAADAFLASGQEDEAEYFYVEFSGRNPDHVLSRAGTLAAAVNHPEGRTYLGNLRQNYPEDVVRDLVQEARNRITPAPRPVPAPNPRPLAPTAPIPILRLNNPVPAPRPQPALPRREPTPTTAPVRPQPAQPRPVPSSPPSQPHKRMLPPGLPEEPTSAGIPAINFFLLLLLVGLAVFQTGWSLILPLLP
jgi:hypothetical protein